MSDQEKQEEQEVVEQVEETPVEQVEEKPAAEIVAEDDPAKDEGPSDEPQVIVAKDGKKDLDPSKIEEDNSNMGSFEVGETFELNGYPFAVKEITGLDVVLRRTDIK